MKIILERDVGFGLKTAINYPKTVKQSDKNCPKAG